MGYTAQDATKLTRAVLVVGMGTVGPGQSSLLMGDPDEAKHRTDALPWLLGQGYSVSGMVGAGTDGNYVDPAAPAVSVGGGVFLVILEKWST